MEHKIYEFVTIAIIFFALSIFILIANLYLSIGIRKDNIRKNARNDVKLNDLSQQIDEIKGLFKADVKYILERIKEILNKPK